ncbi:hypothetical protein ABH926_008143 [Catenulispora sp. GP43]|uniref:hypothetical protein n=1 Tax=Catenulispora sp. GP43 TaxID=3156263 RepID=UPI0035197889
MTETTTPQPAADAPPRRRLPVSPSSIALALASPAVTLSMLALARHWSDHGARHSIGDMVPLGLGAIIGLAVTAWASATEDAVLVGTCGALTAAALGVGMMAYPAGLGEPLIVTTAATVLGWVLTRRVRRAAGIRGEGYAERAKDRAHEATIVGMQCQTVIEVTALREQGATDREKLAQLGAAKRLELALDGAEYEALKLERDVRRRIALTVSDTAREALDTTPRLAIDQASGVPDAVFGPVGADVRRSA